MTKLQPYCFDLPYFAGKAHATVARLKVCSLGFSHGLSFIQKSGRLKSLRTQEFRRPFI